MYRNGTAVPKIFLSVDYVTVATLQVNGMDLVRSNTFRGMTLPAHFLNYTAHRGSVLGRFWRGCLRLLCHDYLNRGPEQTRFTIQSAWGVLGSSTAFSFPLVGSHAGRKGY